VLQVCPVGQACPAVRGVHPHMLATPAPAHVLGAVQVLPQSSMPPQPLETEPHLPPVHAAVIVKGVHPHMLGVPPPPHVLTPVHEAVPQLIMPPQPLETEPHLPAQAAVMLSGVQPQTLGVPPPPHVLGEVQLGPQLIMAAPQPGSKLPQLLPVGQLAGMQVLTQVPLELQAVPVEQPPFIEPQLTVPPQPSGCVPQLRVPQAADAVLGVQPQTLATLGDPPAQVCGEVQVPQLIMPPHPSDTASQFLPVHATVLVFGVQPQTFAVPPPPQVCGATQLSTQATVSPQLLGTLPQRIPFWQV